jgi:hypothetical protein
MVEADKEHCLISRVPASRANDIVDFRPSDYLLPCFELFKANKQFPNINGMTHNAKLSI